MCLYFFFSKTRNPVVIKEVFHGLLQIKIFFIIIIQTTSDKTFTTQIRDKGLLYISLVE